MEAKYRSKKFCSDKCRIYWNRENKKTPEVNVKQSMGKMEMLVPNNDRITLNGKKIARNSDKKFVTVKFTETKEDREQSKKHPLYKEGDPSEGSMSFFLKYGVSSYDEIEGGIENKK